MVGSWRRPSKCITIEYTPDWKIQCGEAVPQKPWRELCAADNKESYPQNWSLNTTSFNKTKSLVKHSGGAKTGQPTVYIGHEGPGGQSNQRVDDTSEALLPSSEHPLALTRLVLELQQVECAIFWTMGKRHSWKRQIRHAIKSVLSQQWLKWHCTIYVKSFILRIDAPTSIRNRRNPIINMPWDILFWSRTEGKGA